jgi:threonine/homoserine/homoserine lactone efflux protein
MTDFLSQLDWRTFFLAMVLIELTPGPNMGWLAALSAQHGKRVGMMAVLGVTLGLGLQVIAAAAGVSAVLSNFPIAYQSIRWAGVLFMLWLAWEAFSDTAITASEDGSSKKGFRHGLIANLLNPKALMFYVVVIGQFAEPSLGEFWWQILILGGLHLIVATTVHLLIVTLGATLGDNFERWRTSLQARLFFSFSLVAVAIWVAVSTGG